MKFKSRLVTLLSVSALILSCMNSSNAVAPMCKSPKPAFTEVSERTFLVMKKNIHKYDEKRFKVRALIQSFYEEQGIVYFDAYWVGKGTGGVSFGTRGMLAYGVGDPGKFDKLVEGDIVLANIVIRPVSDPPTSKPIFWVCSVSVINK